MKALVFVAAALGAAALGAAAMSPTPAQAQAADPNTADVRCMVVTLNLIGSGDAQQRQAGQGAILYFLGRIDARAPGYNLEDAVFAQSRAMSANDLKSEGERCGGMLIARGQELTAIGQRISEREARESR